MSQWIFQVLLCVALVAGMVSSVSAEEVQAYDDSSEEGVELKKDHKNDAHKHGHKKQKAKDDHGEHRKKTDGSTKLHPAHTHGIAELNVVQSGSKVKFTLSVPLDSLVGFEYKPKTEAEKKSLAEAEKKLTAGNLFAVTKGSCKVENSQHKLHYTKGHAEARVEAAFDCAEVKSEAKEVKKAKAKSSFSAAFSVRVKQEFSRVEVLKVQVASDKKKAYSKEFKEAAFDLTF